MNKNAIFLSKLKKVILFSCAICCCFGATGHTIRWHVGDEVIETTTCDAGDTITPPNVPVRPGYSLVEWQPAYIFFDYITIPNEGYIDTGISFDSDTNEIEAEVKISMKTSSGTRNYLGTSSKWLYTSGSGVVFGLVSQDGVYAKVCSGGNCSSTMPDPAEQHIYLINTNRITQKTSVYRDGSFIEQFNSGAKYSASTIYLGKMHRDDGGTMGGSVSDVYYLRIKKDGVLVGDFRPAQRTSDNAYGMYDMITNVFFLNSGSGALICGPAVE